MIDWIKQMEEFPSGPHSEWQQLFDEEGFEIRKQPMKLNWVKYANLKNRLVFLTARLPLGEPIGYAAGYVFSDLHWGDRVATDDIWFVRPQYRQQGIGRILKDSLHQELKNLGAIRVYELVRSEFYHPSLVSELGYTLWGARWVKEL